MSATEPIPAASLTFEVAFARLREIALELEGETLSLEESLQRFEEATGLAARCQALLQEAEDRITVLQNGTYVAAQITISD